MSFINCPVCGKEYYLHHRKTFTRERGESLRCESGNCNGEVFRYSKGTDDYTLLDARTYRARLQREEEEFSQYPICDCGKRMVPRESYRGKFYGCADFPNGCDKIVNR
ncbi:hypothetical protein NLU03_22970 [Bacillus toyonensis]|nr:hypothetical protein [Bacillus toyonensis]